jgi:hypothetical protein
MSTSLLDQYYLFTLTLECGQVIRLTNASHAVKNNSESYIPRSALNIKSASINDSGNVLIVLDGSYEQGGVYENNNLLNCKVSIDIFDHKTSTTKAFALCECIKVEDFARNFRMHLSSKIYKMHQSLTQKYSITCRAQFGDRRCQIDMNKLYQEYDVKEAWGNTISFLVPLTETKNRNHYFDNGAAFVNMGVDRVSRVVLKHTLNEISSSSSRGDGVQCETVVLQDTFPESVMQGFMNKQICKITLAPGCNKLFQTCCFYGNNVNFQGEPFLPSNQTKTTFLT